MTENQTTETSPVEQSSQDAASAWARVLNKNLLLYPCEPVIRWLAANRSRHKLGSDAIDIGFGSGQHLQLLMDYGFCAHGTELIPEAIKRGQEILGRSRPELAGRIILGDLDHPDLDQSLYSLAVAWGVVFLKPRDGMLQTLNRVHSLLEPGGDFCLNFRTPDNWFYGLGEEVETNFFRLDERAHEYRGVEYTFLDLQEASRLCEEAGFSIVNTERVELYKNESKERHSWVVLWLRRPD